MGFNQTQAAEFFGVSQATYCDWENAKKTPRGQSLAKIEQKTAASSAKTKVPVLSWLQEDPPAPADSGEVPPVTADATGTHEG